MKLTIFLMTFNLALLFWSTSFLPISFTLRASLPLFERCLSRIANSFLSIRIQGMFLCSEGWACRDGLISFDCIPGPSSLFTLHYVWVCSYQSEHVAIVQNQNRRFIEKSECFFSISFLLLLQCIDDSTNTDPTNINEPFLHHSRMKIHEWCLR